MLNQSISIQSYLFDASNTIHCWVEFNLFAFRRAVIVFEKKLEIRSSGCQAEALINSRGESHCLEFSSFLLSSYLFNLWCICSIVVIEPSHGAATREGTTTISKFYLISSIILNDELN